MRKDVAVGIDIGTSQVKVIVTERDSDSSLPRILGTGVAESKGVRHGYIISLPEVVKSIRKAVSLAERSADCKIDSAYVSIGGVGLGSCISQGMVLTSRADSEITSLDIEKAIDAAQTEIPQSIIINRKIIHINVVGYKIDGKNVLASSPVGMKANKLEVRVMFVTILEHHYNELMSALSMADIDVENVAASPIASSYVALSAPEKIAGCVLANIGSETVSIAVFENSTPISTEVFPIGSDDITKDIALGFQVSLEEAENIKRNKEELQNNSKTISKKRVDDIVGARLSDIFELIDVHLKKLNRSGVLPAGIIMTGGGSSVANIEDFARATLRLPSKVFRFAESKNPKSNVQTKNETSKIKDATWTAAYGLCVMATIDADEFAGGEKFDFGLGKVWRDIKNLFKAIFSRFLP